jgi:probable phosphoglycerate mutase
VTAEEIVLWRHGRTSSNADGRFQGQLDVPLDDVGRAQAAHAAQYLAEIVKVASSCTIVSSDLSRATGTARALAESVNLPVITDPGLRERHAGAWEGLLKDEIVARHPVEFAAWRAGEDIPLGGGERFSESAQRAAATIRHHAAAMDGGVLVVVSHGAALRGALLRLLGLEDQPADLLDGLRNAHWARLRCRVDGWQLHSYNVGGTDGAPGIDG